MGGSMHNRRFSPAIRILIAFLVVCSIGFCLQLPVSASSDHECESWFNDYSDMAQALTGTGSIQRVNPAAGEKQDYRQTPTADYFNQQSAGHLTPDEWMDFRSLQEFMNPPTSDFTGYNPPTHTWKYGLAFTAYGLANVPYIERGQRVAMGHYLDKLIQKMKEKKVWEHWVELGYGPDPITKHNIMYKGHLNLMYGLYGLITGGTKWENDFKWLTNNIIEEMNSSSHAGVTCEPDDWYVQCNSIGVYSILVYDKLYGTNHSKEVNNWLKFVKTRIVLQPSGLLARAYHPEHDYVEDWPSGYSNAWTIAFLNAIDPPFAAELYPKFKKAFVKESGPVAYTTEYEGGALGGEASAMTLLLAKEMGDQDLFDKVLNLFEKYNTPTVNGPTVSYKNLDKNSQGFIFFSKVNIGLGKLLAGKPLD
jgi:hypothetical protein